MKAQQQSSAELAKSQFRKFTYRNLRINDRTLDDNLPTHPGDHISSSPKVGVGALDTFPIEILHYILAQLDLRTLTNFYHVNHRARHLVASLPHYKAIDTHARNVLRGILSISMGPWITLETLYQALCTAECASCGAFGGYLYLLTCTRVCYLCFTEHDSYLPQRRLQAMQRFSLTSPLLNTLPQMLGRAGTYSPHSKKCRAQLDLVDGNSARQAGVALHGSAAAMEERAQEAAEQKLRQYRDRRAQWAAKSSTKSSARRPPRTEVPWDGEEENPLRFMAVVRAPWLDRSSQSVEWGAYCKGCKDLYDGEGDFERGSEIPLHFRLMFNVASFDVHLRQHGAIKKGKHRINSR